MQSTVISHEITGTISGQLKQKSVSEQDSLDMDDFMGYALKTGTDNEIAFVQ